MDPDYQIIQDYMKLEDSKQNLLSQSLLLNNYE